MASAKNPHTAISTICHRGRKVGEPSGRKKEDVRIGSMNTEGVVRRYRG